MLNNIMRKVISIEPSEFLAFIFRAKLFTGFLVLLTFTGLALILGTSARALVRCRAGPEHPDDLEDGKPLLDAY